MHEAALDAAWIRYAAHLSGDRAGAVCVISRNRLGTAARDAIDASARRLGYGDSPCTFLALEGEGAAHADEAPGFPQALEGTDLFTAVESIDPYAIVIADSYAARAVGAAYRAEAAPFKRTRILGRSAVAFPSFEALLESPEDKQRAWATLKLLGTDAR